MAVRYGAPIVRGEGVEGHVLTFRSGIGFDQAYSRIRSFEPAEVHESSAIQLESGVNVNVLQGRFLDRGNPVKLDGRRWTFRMDPVFTHGLTAVKEIIDTFGRQEFQSAPPEPSIGRASSNFK